MEVEVSEFVTVSEAARLLGVSRHAIGRRIATGRLRAYPAEWDRRQRLLRRADVERLSRLHPSTEVRR
jgi:excisionase family DNA binding protein